MRADIFSFDGGPDDLDLEEDAEEEEEDMEQELKVPEEPQPPRPSKYKTYVEYFKKRHGIDLDPTQPMLECIPLRLKTRGLMQVCVWCLCMIGVWICCDMRWNTREGESELGRD